MPKLTENSIEHFAIELLKAQGYEYIYAPDIAPDSDAPLRQSFQDVLLKTKLSHSLSIINPALSSEHIDTVIKQIERLQTTELLVDNANFHTMLTEGVTIDIQKDGVTRGEIVQLIDFDNVDNNDFVVSNQFTIIENGINKRPDVILFVNGIPLVLMELKNPTDENATIGSAYKQMHTYMNVIPSLFTYNAFCIISDGLEARAGTISADLTRFMAWKSQDGTHEASNLIPQIETLITGMLHPHTLLDLIRNFIVYESTTKVDAQSGITTITPIKKLAAYHQYYAVNKAVEKTKIAAAEHGDKKAGVVWHTQGSGKSLSMVFYTGKIVLSLHNPTVLVITDRNDLDDQLFSTFASSASLLRQTPVQAEDRADLKRLLKVVSGGVIFTTIQKFLPEEGNIYDELTDRSNVIVIADEAHRTQYGFKPKTVDGKTVYGFAKYLRDALPNATYLGFTGTPIESIDVNTPAVFGNYVDIYDIAQAVEDGAIVRIYYESRLAKIALSDEGKALVKELDSQLEQDDLSNTQKEKAKWTQLEALVGSENRIKEIAQDIVSHFEKRQEVFEGKGMIVSMSRRIASALYEEIIHIEPDWHDDDLNKGVIKVVMTSNSSDGPEMARHHTTKEQRRNLANRMKDPYDELQLVIVRDMWLTGFDVPALHTLYIDKPMKGHNLMQAIARVNRVYKDKPSGLVVDYLGIASDLKQSLAFYSQSGGKGDPVLVQEQALELMFEKLEVVSQMYHGFEYQEYFKNDNKAKNFMVGESNVEYFQDDTQKKLAMILAAEEHILGLEDGKKRYIDEVSALSKAFAMAVPQEPAMEVKEEIAFFQAVKTRLVKFNSSGSGQSDEEIATTIKQVIDKALVTEHVVDIFDASGIKKPDISILSEDFLREVRGLQHKNIAIEVLRKLLNDEIKARTKKNLVQGKTLMEMLEDSIKKYQNKILTAAEVIEELIALGKDIQKMDDQAKNMALTDFEFAFYSAIADNNSAKEVMAQDQLRELAVVLTEKIRKNASIDWTIRQSVRDKLKVIVKRTLREYGYPPDMSQLATDTVLKQAEMIANELSAA